MAGAPWSFVKTEHQRNDGFVEGPGNKNPWTEELGLGDAAYCASEATVVPHHNGIDWGPDAQVPHKGVAYCPYLLTWAVKHGCWEADHASQGHAAMIFEGDLLLWDWNFDGVADHCETAMQDDAGADGQVHGIFGANTGTPEGCHSGITRPRKYLLGVVHMAWAYPAQGAPASPPAATQLPPAAHGNLHLPLVEDGQFGSSTIKALQWRLGVPDDGAFGPETKKSLQRFLKVNPDGNIGPVTVRALQTHVGAHVDGGWGADTTHHIQHALNTGTF